MADCVLSQPVRVSAGQEVLVALCRNCSPKLRHFLKQLQHQIFEVSVRKVVKIGRRARNSE